MQGAPHLPAHVGNEDTLAEVPLEQVFEGVAILAFPPPPLLLLLLLGLLLLPLQVPARSHQHTHLRIDFVTNADVQTGMQKEAPCLCN